VKITTATPIADLLEAAGVTRSALADMIGVRQQSVRDGEAIQLATLIRAADALGYTVEIHVVKKSTSS
jgi:ribosome-binding protein aMBF1 (putative translation factor)